jgi:hypothetical protein
MTILNGQFITALLLTRSAAQAECSVLEGIASICQGDVSDDAILTATLRAAIAAPVVVGLQRTQMQDLSTSSLPVELHRVLLLPESLRHCFVLRLLVGLSVSECSLVLSLTDCQVEQNTVAAALVLSGIRELEAESDGTLISVVGC